MGTYAFNFERYNESESNQVFVNHILIDFNQSQ